METEEIIEVNEWVKTIPTSEIPADGGVCIRHEGEQIALFNYARRGEIYATQNLCPHKQQMVLSRGMLGDKAGTPKVACPFHKKQFSLETGACISGDDYQLKTYPVKVEDGFVYLGITG